MPKAEKLQAIHAVVISVMIFLLKKQQELASLFVTLKFLMFVIFFDPSAMLQCSCSVEYPVVPCLVSVQRGFVLYVSMMAD